MNETKEIKKNLQSEIRESWKEFVYRPLGMVIYGFIILILLITAESIGRATLLIAGWTAAFFAYKRAKAVEIQIKATERSKGYERFDRICSMLEPGKSKSVQIGGLIGLNNLARDNGLMLASGLNSTNEHKKNAFEVACSFMRNNENAKEVQQYAIDLFLKKGENEDSFFYAELKAMLKGVDFTSQNLVDAFLKGADLQYATLFCNFEGAILEQANMRQAKTSTSYFGKAKMKGATVPDDVYDNLPDEQQSQVNRENPK